MWHSVKILCAVALLGVSSAMRAEDTLALSCYRDSVLAAIHYVDTARVDGLRADTLSLVDTLLAKAKTYIGSTYRYGADGSQVSFDCSGFVRYVFAFFGFDLPHSSGAQYQMNKGHLVPTDSVGPGDLVFFRGRKSGAVGHVGIVVENDSVGHFSFIHAATHSGVCISYSEEPYYRSRYVGARRVIPAMGYVGTEK